MAPERRDERGYPEPRHDHPVGANLAAGADARGAEDRAPGAHGGVGQRRPVARPLSSTSRWW